MAAASLYLIFMLSFLSFLLFLTLSVIIFSLYTILNKFDEISEEKSKKIPSLPVDDADNYEKKGTQQQKQENAYKSDKNEDPNDKKGSDQEENKRKKKRVKKKRPDSNCVEKKDKEDFLSKYPFTKSSSAIQRKIKLQYDQLVKSHESKSFTLAQVGKFVNFLIEARNEMQNKSEVIKRKFIITKAILFKADKSSVNRLHQQIYKLELEHKRLEDDAFVYNWLQQQLKLSPAYEKIALNRIKESEKVTILSIMRQMCVGTLDEFSIDMTSVMIESSCMLELGACMEEIKANSVDLVESTDANFPDISFEELLAQEKKDSFWQRKGRYKPCLG